MTDFIIYFTVKLISGSSAAGTFEVIFQEKTAPDKSEGCVC